MESNTELAEKYNTLLKEYNQTLKDAIATELKYKEIHTKTKIQEAAIELLAEKHLKLKERCEKMEAALNRARVEIEALNKRIGLISTSTLMFIDEALKEGESNTSHTLTQERADFIGEVNNRDLPESNTPDTLQGEKEETKEITMSYTKGEWYLQKFTDAYTNIIRCNNGKHETIFIASTPQSTLPETRANAKLMAAAPDLLEALQEVVRISDRNHVAWVKAKAAIEKAIGNDNSQQ
jgi:hypothetical protein